MDTEQSIIEQYVANNFRLVFWPATGDAKGPKEPGWTQSPRGLADYREGLRVGILTGVEVAPGRFLHDVDIDWEPGGLIAQALLPRTEFVFGRKGKRVSHCFYTLPEALPTVRYEDPTDKTCLIEFRGTKLNGEIGFQTMAPPSIWSRGEHREPLTFVKSAGPSFVESATFLKQRVMLSAIGMLLAKHLGGGGFGHEARLAWAGFLLRAGVGTDDLITMGEAMLRHCGNADAGDVRFAVQSTDAALRQAGKKVKGGPSLAKMLGGNGKAVVARINEWLGRDDFVRSEGVVVKDHQQNIRRAIDLLGKELSYNSFSDKMLVDGVPLEDRQMADMWLRIDEEHRFRPTYAFFEKVVHRIAWENAFHPVKNYLSGLKWDGTPRIDTWLVDCAGAEDSDYVRAVGSIVLIAAVRRIHRPGAKYDEMLVIEGKQGLNKSSALRALCPHSDWFSDDLPLNTTAQRIIEATLGKWIIEAADLAGRRKAEIESLKASISRQIDGPARLAYAHLPVERPRQFIIIGTTNSAAYLSDPTGARRFWPVAIKSFDVGMVSELRDQLWAEAAHREAQGESIRLHESLWSDAAEHQEKRREIDPWEPIIRNLLLNVHASGDNKRRIATEHIWDGLNVQTERRDRYGAIRIAEIMHRLGFKRTTVRIGDEVQTGYVTEHADALEMRDEGAGDAGGGKPDGETPF